MKRYNHRTTLTAVLATALLLAACAKSNVISDIKPPIPAGMGELTLGELLLNGNDLPAGYQASESSAAAIGAEVTPTAAATRATTSNLPSGATLRLYAFKKGETDFGTKLATRIYTVDVAGVPQLDAGQDPLYLPVGEVDIYLAGPVSQNSGTADAPQIEDIAGEYGIYPRIGTDLIAAHATASIVSGNNNPLSSMTLTHKMALAQVVISKNTAGVYENLKVKEVKLFAQPTSAGYTLDNTGGKITDANGNNSDITYTQIKEEVASERYSITTPLIPQTEKEFKIETTFECNQTNLEAGDNHPTLRYRQSGLITSALAAGTATRFSAEPLTPVEIKWRTKVLPWNEVAQDDIVVPGLDGKVPTTPPTANQYIEIDGLKWTTGNLVAKNTFQCMVGEPSDYGVYFQFGSLIGWTGGADGSGTGQGEQAADKRVWPIEMGRTKPAYNWQNNNAANISTLSNYYFNYSANGWNTEGRDLRDFDEAIDGDAGTGTLASGRYAKQGVGDPCTYYLGDPWRLPTQAEIFALKERGYGTWQQYVGANGRWFGPGNAAGDAATAIFLPAAGHRYYSSSNNWQIGGEGRYGTTSIVSATQHNYMFINSGGVNSPDKSSRSAGLPARCVSGTYVKPANPVTPPTADQKEQRGLIAPPTH